MMLPIENSDYTFYTFPYVKKHQKVYHIHVPITTITGFGMAISCYFYLFNAQLVRQSCELPGFPPLRRSHRVPLRPGLQKQVEGDKNV